MAHSDNEHPTIPDDRGSDLVNLHLAYEADLVLFMAGNQFMAMPDLVETFQESHPEVQKIFYETLPPRLELRQILSGGAWFRGELLTVMPDLYSSVSRKGVDELAAAGLTDPDQAFVYLHNRIALMVRAGNPKGIRSVEDLGFEEIRVSQPSPEFEDIAEHIVNMYREAGDERLVRTIMQDKVRDGSTMLTVVHHRQTPKRLLRDRADVGPVWATEIIHARSQDLPLEGIDLPRSLDQHEHVNYWLCPVGTGRNPENGAKFASFIRTREAQQIFKDYGFTPAN